MAKDKQPKHGVAGAKVGSGKMKRKEFEKELTKLQIELTRLQTWVQATGARIIVVFEGRDTAGKGGVISRITARTSPRVYRHVALPKPSDREKTQVYAQRYIARLSRLEQALHLADSTRRWRDFRFVAGLGRPADYALSEGSISPKLEAICSLGESQRHGAFDVRA